MSTTSEILTGARTMWELVDRRAEASPDHPMLIAADGETLTFGAVPRPGRAGGRRPRTAWASAPARWSPGSCRPGSTPSSSPLRWPGSARSRTRSSTSTASVRSASPCARPAPRSSSSPARGATPTTPRSPSGPSQGADAGPTILTIDDGLPEADPARPAPAPRGDGRRGRPDPLDLLHLGLHRRPQGRAAHRPDPDRRRLGPGPRPRHDPRRRRLHRLPVRPHRRPRLPRDDAVLRVPRHPGRGVLGARRAARSSAGTAPRWSAAAPPSTWPTSPSSARHPASPSCRRCGSCRAAARPSRPRSTSRCATRSAGAASCTATA